MNTFETLIHDLGAQMELTLKVDANQACRLEFQGGITLQIDLDHSGERLLVGCELGQLSPPAYREKALRQALIVNGMTTLEKGTLAFSEKNSSLILFHYFNLFYLNAAQLYQFLLGFVEHASIWISAINSGEIPQVEEHTL